MKQPRPFALRPGEGRDIDMGTFRNTASVHTAVAELFGRS